MNKENTAQTFSGLVKNNRVLRNGFMGLLLVVLVETFALAFRHQIIVIVPSNQMVKATYTSNSADEGALSSWGLYLVTLLGNVTPSNADFVANSVGHLLAPNVYKDVMGGIADLVKHVKEDQLTTKFDPAIVKCDANKGVVWINGWMTTYDAHGTSSRQEVTYEIYFDVVNYQPRVIGFNHYEGKPHMGQ